MTHVILLAATGFLGGLFGAMAGLGGGVFIIPGLTLFLGVPIHNAVAASLIAVVATSTTGAAAYVRENLVNMRLGITLETLTVLGALTGGLLTAVLSGAALSAIFGIIMIAVSVYMAVSRQKAVSSVSHEGVPGSYGARYSDRSLGREVSYRPRRLWAGLAASLVAGNVSGMLGVGGGFLQVPTMVLAMGVPARAAVATSSFMIGVTACAGSLVYLARGLADPVVVVPVVLGVSAGAYIGSKVALRVRGAVLIGVLAAVLFILSLQMILAAAGIKLR